MPCAEESRVFGSVVHPSNRERLYCAGRYAGVNGHGIQYHSQLKVVCIETNDFALSGVVPMVARRVVTTRVFTRSLKLKQDSVERKNEFDSLSKFPSHDLRFPFRVHDVENRIPAPISLQPPFCPFTLISAPFPPFFGSSSR
jgi:hypothetical protein